jgi:hypothetical protein
MKFIIALILTTFLIGCNTEYFFKTKINTDVGIIIDESMRSRTIMNVYGETLYNWVDDSFDNHIDKQYTKDRDTIYIEDFIYNKFIIITIYKNSNIVDTYYVIDGVIY